ncbi:hypothetical protein OUZ56_007212 [Daphnia magna]|uniref:Uncharacterized protein n=1 Tax=Daphnia magna TaxID=35525 RepID=A0ABQ9YXX8_9CRUS|nr:hypothetical protein OUZ56_007212 [Daphnia magna]
MSSPCTTPTSPINIIKGPPVITVRYVRVEDDVGSKGKEGKSGCRNPDALASFNAHLRSIRNSGVS